MNKVYNSVLNSVFGAVSRWHPHFGDLNVLYSWTGSLFLAMMAPDLCCGPVTFDIYSKTMLNQLKL